VQPLLRKCLAKDPKQRLRDIGDAALLLRENANAPASGRATSRLAWAIAALALLGSVGLSITYRIAPRESPGMMKASLLYPDVAVPTNYAVPAISPDGKRVAFVASSGGGGALGQLFVRTWIRSPRGLWREPTAPHIRSGRRTVNSSDSLPTGN